MGCTNDAGANWNRTLFLPGPQNSLLDITATGTAGEYWAVGGTLSSLDANATFLHSTISGSYASAVDCVDSKHCWATTLQVFLQTSLSPPSRREARERCSALASAFRRPSSVNRQRLRAAQSTVFDVALKCENWRASG